MKVLVRLFIFLLLLVSLAACGGGAGPTPTTSTLTGAIGVAKQRGSALGTQGQVFALSVADLNKHIISFQPGSDLAAARVAPVRGLNAAVLGSFLETQSGGQRPLFSMTSKSILAVDRQGNVVASAAIQADGNWSLEVKNDVWRQAGVIGLFQGYESQNGWVCEKPLEYEDEDGEKKKALFGFDKSASILAVQSESSTGLFNFDPDDGNPTSEDDSDIEPVDDQDFNPDCSGDDIVTTSVTADFFWQTPLTLQEADIYRSAVGYAIDTRNQNNPSFVNVAPINAKGIMDMPIFKPSGLTVPMALVLSDAGLLRLDSLNNLGRLSMPLAPTFDLNAAIRFGNPSEPRVIEVGDSGYNYEPSVTRGGMALISGKVTDSQGNPAANTLIIGVIDNDDLIAFNLGLSRPDGSYEILLPATGPELPYYIVAISQDETEVGIPRNIPQFRGDQNELRFSLNTASAFTNADIRMVKAEGGEPDPEPGQDNVISGTVTVPAGQDVQGVEVFVCIPDFSECPARVVVDLTGASASYSIPDVPAGRFVIVAAKDLTGDRKADLLGFYGADAQGKNPTPVSAPATNINITMQPVRGGGGDDSGGSEGQTISGTVTAPPGSDVNNTNVLACDAELKCVAGTVIGQNGPSASYTIPNVPDGNWNIVAVKDVNNNNRLGDTGDFFGCHSVGEGAAEGKCTLVSATASGIDITMTVIGGGGGGGGGGATISGTVTGPKSLKGTAVFTCTETTCEHVTVIQEEGTSAAYSIQASAGTFTVWALQDLNDNGRPDPGELIGCFTTDGQGCSPVTAPATGINFEVREAPAQGQGLHELQNLMPLFNVVKPARLVDYQLNNLSRSIQQLMFERQFRLLD